MQYKTHLAVSLAVGIPLMSCAGDLNFPNAMALCAGTLLPDIDHPGSYMGKRIKFISKVANKTLGHRGGTHSLLFAGFLWHICEALSEASGAAEHCPPRV